MFYNKRNFLIVPVTIKIALREHKADSKWIRIYEETKDKAAIENYWNGITFDNNPQFEYLIDGQIELINPKDKEDILLEYKKRHIK